MSAISARLQHIKNLRKIFLHSVESVQPHKLLDESNGFYLRPKLDEKSNSTTIQIQDKTLDITEKRCHVVGFGKAVLGMAVQLEKQLGAYLSSGVLSIPENTLKQFAEIPEMQLSANSCLQVFEGAPNNHPDHVALKAALEIKNLVASMTEDDILFVLISGGGSALLPMPKKGISLEDKMQLIRKLANLGASIQELNVVRIALSDIKGGLLATAAHKAHAVISFIINDIVGDNTVDLVASGPTCAYSLKRGNPIRILQEHNVWDTLPQHIRSTIKLAAKSAEAKMESPKNSAIYVVGDNRVATAVAVNSAVEFNYNPFIASTTITGEVSILVDTYVEFLKNICAFRRQEIDEPQMKKIFPFDSRIFQHFLKTLSMCEKTSKPLLIITAGEPTVKVTGAGCGGRNQELALRMALALYENPELQQVTYLSAGTDGIDGPTDAAGAIGSSLVVEEYLQTNKSVLDLKKFLLDNDSYNFYKSLSGGKYHIITGHTGTNVMDLHFMLVPWF